MKEEKKNAMTEPEKTNTGRQTEETQGTDGKLSPTWAQDCIEDIDEWIESQGIYLRQ